MRLTSQQNGVAECLNRSLLEVVRCQVSNAHLPKHFWIEEIYTTSQLINKYATSALDFKIFISMKKL